MYEQDDTRHYDDFDYVEKGQPIQQFEPDSDMDFVEFKKLMKKEWEEQAIQKKSSSCFFFGKK